MKHETPHRCIACKSAWTVPMTTAEVAVLVGLDKNADTQTVWEEFAQFGRIDILCFACK